MVLDKLIKTALCCCTLSAATWAFGQNAPVIDLNQDPSSQSTPVADDASNANASDTSGAPDQSYSRDSLPTRDRLRILEQQMANLTQMNLPAKIDSLQQQLQQLNGQLEVQEHELQALSDQQKSFYQDINQRLGGSQAAGKTKTTTTQTASTPTADASATATNATDDTTAAIGGNTSDQIAQAEANVTQNNASAQKAQVASQIASAGSDDKAYQSAFDLLASKKTMAAVTAFQEFIKSYPSSSYLPNAHYWLGELYSQQNKAELAAKEFTLIIQKYPQNAKAPDAMLALAIIHDNAGLHTQAQQEIQKLIQKFPNSSAAKLAKMRLQQMKSSGDIQAQSSP